MKKKQLKIGTKEFGTKQNFFKELKVYEHIILGLSIAGIFALFIYNVTQNYGKMSPYFTGGANIFNILSVMACIKKKPLYALLGLVGSGLSIPTMGIAHKYALLIMQLVYCVVYIVTFIIGVKNSDNKTSSIKPRSIKGGQSLIYFLIIAGLIAMYTGVEGLQSYQDAMARIGGISKGTIPPLHVRIFESAALMITVSLILPNFLRLKNLLPIYLLANLFQIATGIAALVDNYADFNAGMMLINILSFATLNTIGIFQWYKDSLNKLFHKKVA